MQSSRYGSSDHGSLRYGGGSLRNGGRYGSSDQDNLRFGENHETQSSLDIRPKHGRMYETPSPQRSDAPSSSLSLRRRGNEAGMGGYGHFASGRRDTDNHSTNRDRSPKITGIGPGGRALDDVLAHITEHWSIMKQEDCVPVQVALQLLDYSSLGRANDYYDFQKTSKALNNSMKGIVNDHHQGFNSSIGTFHSIQASIQASQHRVRSLRDSVVAARGDLVAEKPELKALGASSQQYDDALRLLDQIEQLQRIPEALDGLIAEKHFCPAVDKLQLALRLLRTTEMEGIGALADLRAYFANQESSLIDILMEELHDHLYLKSPYCQTRWKSRTSLEQAGALAWPATPAKRELHALQNFLHDLSIDPLPPEEETENPEIDSFAYIRSLLEALSKLGQLEATVERVEERLPVELFSIVERTNQEVSLRYSAPQNNEIVLDDLLQTLFAKFEAIAEAHSAMHQVLGCIGKRDGAAGTNLSRGFKELWKLFQSEAYETDQIRSLLHDYLATDSQTAYGVRQPDHSLNPFSKMTREKAKRVLKIADLDAKDGLAKDQKDLDDILEGSVPGLIVKPQRKSDAVPSDRPAAGHKLLVAPDVYNISALLPPTLGFLNRLKDIVPSDADIALSTLTSFLDDFLVNVFNPQLEETVSDLFTQAFSDQNAFQEDRTTTSLPIFHAAAKVMSLITSFSRIMDAVPPDLSTSTLLLTQLQAYLDKCIAWFRAMVKSGNRVKPAATLAETDVVKWIDLAEATDDQIKIEVDSLLDHVKTKPVDASDIISDSHSVAAMCQLHNSLTWLADQLLSLHQVVPSAAHGVSRLLEPHMSQSTRLRVTPELVETFDELLKALRSTAKMVLTTLHVDIRLGTAHMLSRALTATYVLQYPSQDPDPSLLALNADLLATMYTVQSHLDPTHQRYITRGLAQFMDRFIVANSALVKGGMNEHGCGLMQLNLLVLSQNLKSISLVCADTDVGLPRSHQLYEMCLEGPESIAVRARDQQGAGLELFSLEELKAVMELLHREGLQSPQREVMVKSQRELEDRLLVLTECLWNR